MTIISRAIPGLFGGISQQVPAMRHPTQCEDQVNGISTVVEGLKKRPGSRFIAELQAQEGVAPHLHPIGSEKGVEWVLVLTGTSAYVVHLETGEHYPVTYQTTSGLPTGIPNYLLSSNPQREFRTITVADTTFVVNTAVTVESLPGDGFQNPTNVHYVYVRVGPPQHTFRVWLNGSEFSYTTPTQATVDTVVSGLLTAINGQAPGFSAGHVPGTQGLIQIKGPDGFSISVGDSYGNSALQVISKGVQRYADLPPSFVQNYRITVYGTDAGATVDPYYVEWDGSRWKEARKPGISIGFSQETMPHKLWFENGSWYLSPNNWDKRLVGDDDTNPMPSFVGQTIRDIFFFRNRLGFLSGDSIILSRAGRYFNFFSATAREILDSDPIDLGGAGESVETLDWAVPFNQRLVVWATSKRQFILEGGDVLSPLTARLVPTTAFDSDNSARPQQLGNRIVFASTSGAHTQLSMYRVSQDTVTNTAEALTDHVPKLIPRGISGITVSETEKALAVVPASAERSIYVFKYEDDGDRLNQRAWQRFEFTGEVLFASWSDRTLLLVCRYPEAYSGGTSSVCLEAIDFSQGALDEGLNTQLYLDCRWRITDPQPLGMGRYRVAVPSPAHALWSEAYGLFPGGQVRRLHIVAASRAATSDQPSTIDVEAAYQPLAVFVGLPFTFRYTFTEVFMRDGDGIPVMDSRLKLLKMKVRFIDTGHFKVRVETKARGQYEYDSTMYSVSAQGVGVLEQLLGTGFALNTGEFSIPVHAQAAGTRVTIESTSPTPCCFPYAEWRGGLVMKSQR